MECLGENTVSELVDAILAPDRRVAIEAHTARCETCRRIVSELVRRSTVAAGTPAPAPAPRRIAPGTRVGRYVVREPIGEGAMGTVLAAFDPELDRPIALKLLHPGSPAQRERIRREARALARLSHPNVVAAYDVGELDGDLVLAMELVDGTDLRAWTAATHPVGDVLEVYRQAARGLAAAHAAGLVHRDFKPANALIGSDGRVRVVDFGLAVGLDGGTELAGTPAYMAPEVFEAGAADAASDQFSFCVALYEALYGERPFVVNLPDEVARGLRPSAADRPAVPAHAIAAIARGLRADPARRHPSMDALIAALSPRGTPARTWIALGVAGGGLAAIAVAAAVWARGAPAAEQLCRGSEAAYAAIWNPERAAALRTHVAAIPVPFAGAAWRAIEAGMTDFGRRWTAARTEACEATRIRGTQSDQVLTLRSACLDRALGEADQLLAVLAASDRESIARAPAAIGALPALDGCANVTALLAPVPPPTERDAAAVAAIERQIARAKALRDAARWTDAREAANEAVAAARAVAHEPTRAAALLVLGEAHGGAGASGPAEAAMREAFAAAGLGRDDLLAARAATELVFVVGQQQQQLERGLEWAFHAETLLRRAGGDLELAARLAGNLGHIRYSQNNPKLARELYQQAFELRVKASGPNSVAASRALFNLGRAVMAQGDNPGALEMTRRALAILEENLGSQHPDIATGLNGLGVIQFNQGKYADALATIDRALAIARPLLGERHPEVGRMVIVRGHTLHALGRDGDALAAYDLALAFFERDPAGARFVAEVLSGRGDAEQALGRPEDALASYRRALAVREASFGAQSEEAASSLENVAAVHAELGRHGEALALYERALAIRHRIGAPDHFENAYPLAGIGEAHWHLGRARQAVPPLRKAVELLASYDGDPIELAAARFSLARALWDAGEDRAEARRLAAAAEDALASGGPIAARELERVRAWRRAR